jgi:acetaldehyde dehydrogenase (acetylating)
MTLGPGSWGGSITSDNVTPLHLINIKRLGEEIRPYVDPLRAAPGGANVRSTSAQSSRSNAGSGTAPRAASLPAGDVERIVDQFLSDFRASRR